MLLKPALPLSWIPETDACMSRPTAQMPVALSTNAHTRVQGDHGAWSLVPPEPQAARVGGHTLLHLLLCIAGNQPLLCLNLLQKPRMVPLGIPTVLSFRDKFPAVSFAL